MYTLGDVAVRLSNVLYARCMKVNGLVRFAERLNLVSEHVPSHFNWPLPPRVSHTAFIHCSSEIHQICQVVSLQSSVTETVSGTLHAAHNLFCVVLRTLYFFSDISASLRLTMYIPSYSG